jgi:hypothetical protein
VGQGYTGGLSEGDQFDAVSEYILNVTALYSGNLVVFTDGNTGGAEFHNQAAIVNAGEGGVSFPGRAEIFFDSQMNVDFAALQPQAAALGEFWRLGKFFHPEEGTIELAGLFFMAPGHGKLHVVKLHERN